MPLSIKITNFEGPFDLLLHLIRKNEMDIYNIKIYEITAQYLETLREMKEMDLEITSEFIVMAATLLEIKSRTLLPKKSNSEDDVKEEEDPRKELVSKLIEYKRYKELAALLKGMEERTGVVFPKKPEIIEEPHQVKDQLDMLKGVSILKLYNMFAEVMNIYTSKMNIENTIQREIPVDSYKIEDKMEEIGRKIVRQKRLYFSEIMNECASKLEIVVTFLALLELIKLKTIKILQEKNFTEIFIEEVSEDEINRSETT